ncbi:hypothetical protein LCGC14_0146530 [marine sediment metagenome]|uniref:Uncharacterized protein n=1 Tax=marine sediment metagenome TaxID=412755 RepID=A0A0F9VFH0_9ZZZZ
MTTKLWNKNPLTKQQIRIYLYELQSIVGARSPEDTRGKLGKFVIVLKTGDPKVYPHRQLSKKDRKTIKHFYYLESRKKSYDHGFSTSVSDAKLFNTREVAERAAGKIHETSQVMPLSEALTLDFKAHLYGYPLEEPDYKPTKKNLLDSISTEIMFFGRNPGQKIRSQTDTLVTALAKRVKTVSKQVDGLGNYLQWLGKAASVAEELGKND